MASKDKKKLHSYHIHYFFIEYTIYKYMLNNSGYIKVNGSYLLVPTQILDHLYQILEPSFNIDSIHQVGTFFFILISSSYHLHIIFISSSYLLHTIIISSVKIYFLAPTDLYWHLYSILNILAPTILKVYTYCYNYHNLLHLYSITRCTAGKLTN